MKYSDNSLTFPRFFSILDNIFRGSKGEENYEKEILLDKQQELKGDINAMAEQLSISKRALIYKLKKYGV